MRLERRIERLIEACCRDSLSREQAEVLLSCSRQARKLSGSRRRRALHQIGDAVERLEAQILIPDRVERVLQARKNEACIRECRKLLSKEVMTYP